MRSHKHHLPVAATRLLAEPVMCETKHGSFGLLHDRPADGCAAPNSKEIVHEARARGDLLYAGDQSGHRIVRL
jgi:hypothetical protein